MKRIMFHNVCNVMYVDITESPLPVAWSSQPPPTSPSSTFPSSRASLRVRSHQSPRSHLLVLPLGLLLVSGCPLKQPLGLTDFLVPLHLGLPERNVMNWRAIPVCPESHLRSDLVCMNLCCALSLSSGTHLVLK